MPARPARRSLAALIAALALGACHAAPLAPAGPRVVVEPGMAGLAEPGEVTLAVRATLDPAMCRTLLTAGTDENWKADQVSFVRFTLFRRLVATAGATQDVAASDILQDPNFLVHFNHLRRNMDYRVEARAYHDPDADGPQPPVLISIDDARETRWKSAIEVRDDDEPLLEAGSLFLRLKPTNFDGSSQPAGVDDDGEGGCTSELNGNVVTWAGTAAGGFVEGASGKAARLGRIADLARRSDGTVFAALDAQHAVVAISPQRQVRLVLGAHGTSGAVTDGTKYDSRLDGPMGLALSADGNTLYVADTGNHRVLSVDLTSDDFDDAGPAGDDDTGYVKLVAGPTDAVIAANGGSAPVGSNGGVPTAARFDQPTGLAPHGAGGVVVADRGNHLIRHVTPASVEVLAGGLPAALTNGDGATARFDRPFDLCPDGTTIVGDGTWAFLITDHLNAAIRRLAPDGLGGWTVSTYVEGNGSGTDDDELLQPTGIATDGRGRVWVGGMDSDYVNAYVTSFDRDELYDGAGDPIPFGPDLAAKRWVQGFGAPYRDGDARDATFEDGPSARLVPVVADPVGRVYFGDEVADALRLLQ